MFLKGKFINLALLKRSILLEMRSIQQYVGKVILTIIIAFGMFIQFIAQRGITTNGRDFFSFIIYALFILFTILGLNVYASLITTEKQERTLPLLLMTGISASSLVWSKMLSSFISGVGMILLLLPFTLLSITFGGIGIMQILASFTLLFCYLFMLCSVGVFASTISKKTGNATGVALLLLVFFHGGFMMLIGLIFKLLDRLDEDVFETIIENYYYFTSPFYGLVQVLDSIPNYETVLWNSLFSIVFGLFFIFLAVFLFEYFVAKYNAGAVKKVNKSKVRHKGGRVWGTRSLSWKVFNYCYFGKRGLLVKSLVYIGVTIFAVLNHKGILKYEFEMEFLFPVAVLFMFFELLAISGLFAQEKKDGTWSSWAMLPGTIYSKLWQMLQGYIVALLPVIVFFVMAFLIIVKREGLPPLDVCFFTALSVLLAIHFFLDASLSKTRIKPVLSVIIGYVALVFLGSFVGNMNLTNLEGYLLFGTVMILATVGFHLSIIRQLKKTGA